MEKQKTQVMWRQICLQIYSLTASWQDLLFTILCKESEGNRAPSHPTPNPTDMHTQLNLNDWGDGDWLRLEIDRSHWRCRQMINSLSGFVRLVRSKYFQWHSRIFHRCMIVWDKWRTGGAIRELPAALYPHRKSWPVLILIPPMSLVSLPNTAEWGRRRCDAGD